MSRRPTTGRGAASSAVSPFTFRMSVLCVCSNSTPRLRWSRRKSFNKIKNKKKNGKKRVPAMRRKAGRACHITCFWPPAPLHTACKKLCDIMDMQAIGREELPLASAIPIRVYSCIAGARFRSRWANIAEMFEQPRTTTDLDQIRRHGAVHRAVVKACVAMPKRNLCDQGQSMRRR